jgi:quinol monooxygenase YgiN
MAFSRREIALSAVAAAAGLGTRAEAAPMTGAPGGGAPLYGLISQIITAPGKRDELIGVLVEAAGEMPGCLSFIVAKDTARADAVWISEVWASKDDHDRSLRLPKVAAAVARSGPLMASLGARAETIPVGGVGLMQR